MSSSWNNNNNNSNNEGDDNNFLLLNVLLLTQNIGTIECNDNSNENEVTSTNQELTMKWIQSVASFIKKEEKRCSGGMDIVVIHLQEMGGKKMNRPFNKFLSSVIGLCYPDAGWCSGLLYDDTNQSSFTAMGTVIFLSQRLVSLSQQQSAVEIYNFKKQEFIPIKKPKPAATTEKKDDENDDHDNNNNNKDDNDELCYYLGSKFSTAGSSRKGYLLTTLRLGIGGERESKTSLIQLNFLNLHLFNDADNTIAASQPHPSEYVVKRAEAITEAIQATVVTTTTYTTQPLPPRGEKEKAAALSSPLFVFGDFNLRLDTNRLIQMLENKYTTKIRLEKKKIHCENNVESSVWDFFHNSTNWSTLLSQLDLDPIILQKYIKDQTNVILEELPIKFGPTYLLEDDDKAAARRRGSSTDEDQQCINNDNDDDDDDRDKDAALKACYQRGRFPAWCDRFWFNPTGRDLLLEDEDDKKKTPVYWTAPLHPMDHLAVYLRFQIPLHSFQK